MRIGVIVVVVQLDYVISSLVNGLYMVWFVRRTKLNKVHLFTKF